MKIDFCLIRKVNVDAQMLEYKTSKEKIQVHIGLIKNEINQLTDKEKDEDIKNSSDFEKSIAVLIKNGCKIDRFTTVVSEWCMLLNLINEEQKTIKNGTRI